MVLCKAFGLITTLFLAIFVRSSATSARTTYNGCACQASWELEGLAPCSSSCCNPDNDQVGDWCMVEDQGCEESDWGYCRPVSDATSSAQPSGRSSCSDLPGWADEDGDECTDYETNSWCTQSGEPGNGWHEEEWGSLSDYHSNGQTPLQACCACGGGHTSGETTPAPTLAPTSPAPSPTPAPALTTQPPTAGGRSTVNGCACLRSWSDTSGSCSGFCCNPDGDAWGEWCMVADQNCEESDWGYCQAGDGAATYTPPAGCQDVAGWQDSDGDGCSEYEVAQWCSSDGHDGLGWHEEWGTLASFSNNGMSGLQACCVCGGGHGATLKRKTWNECNCQREWTYDGNSCKESCCNPNNDQSGPWCMVEDATCEDSDWGYCQPEFVTTYSGPVGCTDVDWWTDADGDGCAAYSTGSWCTSDGQPGLGWHAEWGTFQSFAMGGRTAADACCACGGGSGGSSNEDTSSPGGSGTVATGRTTFNGCACKQTWTERIYTCSDSCCNPDFDPAGDWCMVEDPACEDDDWGYCKAASSPAVAPPTGTSGCTSTAEWQDSDGDNCGSYASNSWCTNVGGYGLGWHEEWGTFAQFDSGRGSATEACCECGGGTQAAEATAGTTAESADDDDKVRATWSGCECKKTWEMEGYPRCDSFCCNALGEADGEWCMVVDSSCEEADWGYCRTSGIGTRTSDAMQSAEHCADITGWSDTDGDTCNTYAMSAWCTSDGAAGTGWHSEWGTLESFARDGIAATAACCACGGGGAHFNATVGPAVSMWTVNSGPCRIDVSGCAVSGNFPKAYSADEQCQIVINEGSAAPIEVISFDTESQYDELIVNGRSYSGAVGPDGVIPSGTIQWGSDMSIQALGWRLCPRGSLNSEAVQALGLGVGSLEGDLLPAEAGGFSFLKLIIALGLVIALVATAFWYKRNMGASKAPGGLDSAPTKYGRRYATMDDV